MARAQFGLLFGGAMTAVTLACAPTTVRSLTPAGGTPTYKIECMQLDGCLREAQKQCHGAYRTVSTRQNTIAESDLPGLNRRTQLQNVSSNGPGIESDEPMPLTEVVVICNG